MQNAVYIQKVYNGSRSIARQIICCDTELNEIFCLGLNGGLKGNTITHIITKD